MREAMFGRTRRGAAAAGLAASFGLAALLSAGGASAALAETPAAQPPPALMSLSGEGEVTARPDQMRVTLGVTATAPTARAALARDAEQMNAVITALKAAGVEGKDIQTASIALNPQYDYQQGKAPRLTGFVASNTVSALVRSLERAGPVLDAAGQAGANEISQVSFDLSDRDRLTDQARLAAVRSLQDRAALYAKALDLKPLRLVRFSEGVEGGAEPMADMAPKVFALRAAAAPAPSPVEGGEIRIRVQVSGVYALSN